MNIIFYASDRFAIGDSVEKEVFDALLTNQKYQLEAYSKFSKSVISFMNGGDGFVDDMICSCTSNKKLALSKSVSLAFTGESFKSDRDFVKMLTYGYIAPMRKEIEKEYCVDLWTFEEKISFNAFYNSLSRLGVISDYVRRNNNELLIGIDKNGRVSLPDRNEAFRMASLQSAKFAEKLLSDTFANVGLIYNNKSGVFADYIKCGKVAGGEMKITSKSANCQNCKNVEKDNKSFVEFRRQRVLYGLPKEFLVGIILPLPLLLADSFLISDFELLKDKHLFSPTGELLYEPKSSSSLPHAIYDFQKGKEKYFSSLASKQYANVKTNNYFFET